MAIRVRRGLYDDFDANRMLPGEFAVAVEKETNKQVVWMCFYPGVVKRLGTYEDFKTQIEEATEEIKAEYLEEFETILSEIKSLSETMQNNTDSVVQINSDFINTYLPQIQKAVEDSAESASAAEQKSEEAKNYSLKSQSYAVGEGGVRENEEVDNAKYYYEQAKRISQGMSGALLPNGTVTFEELQNQTKQAGYMYNISNNFVTDETFNDGGGVSYPGGTNVYYTADGYWDCLAGTITAEGIGALAADGDSRNNTATFTSDDNAAPQAWTDVDLLTSGEKHSSIFGKISTMLKNIRWLYKKLGTVDISAIGDGTITGAVSQLNSEKQDAATAINTSNIGKQSVNYASNAGSAGAVAWANVTDKPSTYTPATHEHNYVSPSGGTMTGTLVLSKTTDLSGTANNSPALIVGGAATSSHMEFDNNEIQAKASGTTVNNIYIQPDGGDTYFGDSANEYSTFVRNDLTCNQNVYIDGNVKARHIYLDNSKWVYGTAQEASGGVIAESYPRLIGINSANNIHMGDYNARNISPVYLHAQGGEYGFKATEFRPGADATYTLGTSSRRWTTVFAKNGTIQTSDRNKKKNIEPIPKVYETMFMMLQGYIFEFIGGDRKHIGTVSQDVEEILYTLGLKDTDFGGFCKDVRYEYTEFNEDGTPIELSKKPVLDENGNIVYDYSLRYQEFIFLTIHMLQKTIKRLDKVEERLAKIEEKLN